MSKNKRKLLSASLANTLTPRRGLSGAALDNLLEQYEGDPGVKTNPGVESTPPVLLHPAATSNPAVDILPEVENNPETEKNPAVVDAPELNTTPAVASDPGRHLAPASTLTLVQATPEAEFAPGVGFFAVDNYISDVIQPLLSGSQWTVYFRLLRLSHGYHSDTCKVGDRKLAEKTGLSKSTIKNVRKVLIALGLIEVLENINTKDEQCTVYRVYTRLLVDRGVKSTPGVRKNAGSKSTPNTINHDDSKPKNHDQAAPVEISDAYRKQTGNRWTKQDDDRFVKLGAPLELVLARLPEWTQRAIAAGTRPKNFAYFATCYQNEQQDGKQGLAEQYRQIFRDKRGKWTGLNARDCEDKFRAHCEAHGIIFDKQLFNEVYGEPRR